MSGAHLWKLLRLKPADGDLWKAYRKVFIETYVRDAAGNEPLFMDWRGRRVKFHAGNFAHAFTRNPNFREGLDHKSELDERRAQRVLWIKEVLVVSAGTVHLFREQFIQNGDRKRRRVFFVVEETYVVVLDEPPDSEAPLQFVTAYPSVNRNYEREIKRKGGVLIESRRGKAPVLDGD
jgi:hypothetical protein